MRSPIAARQLTFGYLVLFCIAIRVVGIRHHGADPQAFFESSTWYDWGLHGLSPQQSYRSFARQSPKPNIVRRAETCDRGLLFLHKSNGIHDAAQIMIFDNDGNLVWIPDDNEWSGTKVADLTVQQYKGENYIVYQSLDGIPGNPGQGRYIMLDKSYQVFMEIRPIGVFNGELHGFRITETGAAIVNLSNRTTVVSDSISPSDEEEYESIFQEIDLVSGKLLFEWRASAYNPSSGMQTPPTIISSIDKNKNGDYLVAGLLAGTGLVACISHEDGRILWQLGGPANDFKSPSSEPAPRFSGYHHATFLESTTAPSISVHGATKPPVYIDCWDNGRILVFELDLEQMVARLAKTQWLASSTADSSAVQLLPNGNTLFSDDRISSFREVSRNKTLCETHFAPSRLPSLARLPMAHWATNQNYAASKFNWVGLPKTVPTVAVDPEEKAVYVSWNGATTVDAWVLQSGRIGDDDTWFDLLRVPKVHFETRISIPRHAGETLRVVALDQNWNVLAHSKTVSKNFKSVCPVPSARPHYFWIAIGLFLSLVGIHLYRLAWSRGSLSRRSTPVELKGTPVDEEQRARSKL